MDQEPQVAIKVWDLPLRIFHWALVVLFVLQFVTGKIGADLMSWHAWSGYAVLVLVIFRILWGIAGGTHARFSSFITGPRATLRFARRLFSRQAVPQLGHNPLGGWSVIAMIVCFALQAISGLFANDGASFVGPLASLVSFEVSTNLSHFHRWNLKILLLLAGLHVVAVVFHWVVKKDNLVMPMFTGVKRLPRSALRERRDARRGTPPRRAASRESSAAQFGSPWRALALLAAATALVYIVVRAAQ